MEYAYSHIHSQGPGFKVYSIPASEYTHSVWLCCDVHLPGAVPSPVPTPPASAGFFGQLLPRFPKGRHHVGPICLHFIYHSMRHAVEALFEPFPVQTVGEVRLPWDCTRAEQGCEPMPYRAKRGKIHGKKTISMAHQIAYTRVIKARTHQRCVQGAAAHWALRPLPLRRHLEAVPERDHL